MTAAAPPPLADDVRRAAEMAAAASEKASDVLRALAVAGIVSAFCFKEPGAHPAGTVVEILRTLIPAAFFCAAGLACDALQYLVRVRLAQREFRRLNVAHRGASHGGAAAVVARRSAAPYSEGRLPRALFWTKALLVAVGVSWLAVALSFQAVRETGLGPLLGLGPRRPAGACPCVVGGPNAALDSGRGRRGSTAGGAGQGPAAPTPATRAAQAGAGQRPAVTTPSQP